MGVWYFIWQLCLLEHSNAVPGHLRLSPHKRSYNNSDFDFNTKVCFFYHVKVFTVPNLLSLLISKKFCGKAFSVTMEIIIEFSSLTLFTCSIM